MRVPRRYRKRLVRGSQRRHGLPRQFTRLLIWQEREELEAAGARGPWAYVDTLCRFVYRNQIRDMVYTPSPLFWGART